MLDVLQFIFSDFWHWLGTFLLILAIPSLVSIRSQDEPRKREKQEDKNHDAE